MTKVNSAHGMVSNVLLMPIESKTNVSGRLNSLYRSTSAVREHQRAKARAVRKEQIKSAKALQVKSPRGFA